MSMNGTKIDLKPNITERGVENEHYIKNEVIEDIKEEIIPVKLEEPLFKIDINSIKTENLTEAIENKQLFACTYCSEKFEYIEILEVHSSIHKTSPKPKKCPCCTKKYTVKEKYASHVQKHIDKCGSCRFCNKIFFNLNELRKHETEHKKNGALVCPYCGKIFTIQKSLVVHIRVHTNERPYICDICNKSFKQISALRNHQQLLHFERKPYICEVCDGHFSTKSSLKRHLKRIHSAGRTYFCKTCNKDFLNQDCDECSEFHSGISHSDLNSDNLTSQESNLESDIRISPEAVKDRTTRVESKKKKCRFVCPFCPDVVNRFARHVMKMHYDETSVKQILKMPPNSSQRRQAFTRLKEGSFPEPFSESESSLEDNDETPDKRCIVVKTEEPELYLSSEAPITQEISRDCVPDVLKSTTICDRLQNDKYHQYQLRCPFCPELVNRFSRHIIKMHSKERVVKKILKMPLNSLKRRKAFTQLKEESFPESSSESESSVEDSDDSAVKRFLFVDAEEAELYPSSEIPIKHEVSTNCEPGVQKSTVLCDTLQNDKYHQYQLRCPFCPEVVNRFSRHVIKMHSKEKVVKKILKMPVNSLKRRKAFIQLKEGSFPESSSESESSVEDSDESAVKRFLFVDTEEAELYPSSEIPIKHEVSTNCEPGVQKSTVLCDTLQNQKRQIVCIFCFKVVDKFARHVMNKHSDEKSVRKIMKMTPGLERRKVFMQLRMGHFRVSSSESEDSLGDNDESKIKDIRIKCEPGATNSTNAANSLQDLHTKHKLEFHTKLSSFYEICSICHEEFFTYQKYCSHKMQHFKNKKPVKRPRASRKKLIHTCWLCGEEVLLKNVQNHRNKHMLMTKEEVLQCYKSKKYTCKICGYTYSIKKNLLEHMNLHMERVYQCKKGCDPNKMYTYLELNRHNLEAHSLKIGEQMRPCFLCGVELKPMDHKNHINEHIQLNDNEIEECKLAKRFPCKQCGITSPTKSHLLKHVVSHSPKLYSCPTESRCSGKFYTYTGLKEHRRRIHDNIANNHYKIARHNRIDTNILIKKIFECAWCSDTFNNSIAIKNHYKTHKSRDFKCSICDKHFPKAQNISRHMIRKHNLRYDAEDVYRYLVNKSDSPRSDTSKFTCNYCKVSFVSLMSLKKHKKMHYTNRTKCKKCQMCFTKASQYTLHLKRNNCTRWAVEAIITEAKDLKCNYCDKSFSTYFQTTRHISTLHSKELYNCKICNSSHSIDSLITHMMSRHRGLKKYSCAGCQVSFKTFKAYLQHRRWCVQCPLKKKNQLISREPKNEISIPTNLDNQDDFVDIPETVMVNENGDIIVSENNDTSFLDINKL